MSDFPIDRTHPPRKIIHREEGRHLEIRPWSLDDVDLLIAAIEASRTELRAFMPWAHAPVTRELEYRLIAGFQADYWAGTQYVMGMFSESGEVIGGIGLHPRVPLNPKGLEVGYWCRTAHAGRGWTTLAVRMMVSLVFDWLGCDRFQVTHDEANLGSRRVVEKCGFAYEGTARRITAKVTDEAILAGGYRGTGRQRVYAITPDDLQQLEWLPSIRRNLVLIDALGSGPRSYGERLG